MMGAAGQAAVTASGRPAVRASVMVSERSEALRQARRVTIRIRETALQLHGSNNSPRPPPPPL
eukprot:scaffold62213_cov63-Phaeocystis_antarctica.AAC.7